MNSESSKLSGTNFVSWSRVKCLSLDLFHLISAVPNPPPRGPLPNLLLPPLMPPPPQFPPPWPVLLKPPVFERVSWSYLHATFMGFLDSSIFYFPGRVYFGGRREKPWDSSVFIILLLFLVLQIKWTDTSQRSPSLQALILQYYLHGLKMLVFHWENSSLVEMSLEGLK